MLTSAKHTKKQTHTSYYQKAENQPNVGWFSAVQYLFLLQIMIYLYRCHPDNGTERGC